MSGLTRRVVSQHIIDLAEQAWSEERIKKAFAEGDPDIPESTDYFLDRLKSCLQEDYIPSNEGW